MKPTNTRVLAIAILTTSMSAFAMSGKAKTPKDTSPNDTNSGETPAAYVVDQPNSGQDEGQSDKSEKQFGEQQRIQQANQEWLHDLQGIYGG